MSALEDLVASLKRLLGFRVPSSAERIDQASEDRPRPETQVPLEPTVAETPPAAAQTSIPDIADQVAEIKALLEEVAQPPAEPVESEPLPEPAAAPPVGSAPTGSLLLTLATQATTFTVTKSGATLGRAEDNTIRLDDLSVSRRHARIAYRQGGYWLSDLGSMGGTWIGETRLEAAQRIEAGDLIDIGHYRLTASFAGEPTSPSPRRRPSRAR